MSYGNILAKLKWLARFFLTPKQFISHSGTDDAAPVTAEPHTTLSKGKGKSAAAEDVSMEEEEEEEDEEDEEEEEDEGDEEEEEEDEVSSVFVLFTRYNRLGRTIRMN